MFKRAATYDDLEHLEIDMNVKPQMGAPNCCVPKQINKTNSWRKILECRIYSTRLGGLIIPFVDVCRLADVADKVRPVAARIDRPIFSRQYLDKG